MAKRFMRKLLALPPECSSSEEEELGAAAVVAEEIDRQERPARHGGSVYGHRTVHRG